MLITLRTGLVVATLVLTVAVSACSSTEQDSSAGSASSESGDGQVATLQKSPDPSADKSDDPAGSEQVRERLDMTDAERQHLQDVFQACMKSHGVDVEKERIANAEANGKAQSKRVVDAAGRACQDKLPLPPWEIDVTNPQAIAFGRKVVSCLRAKGVEYVELWVGSEIVAPSYGGPQNDAESISKGLEFTPECEREVANQ